MNKLFLDTNVLLDTVLPDRPSQDASRRVLALCGREGYRVMVSSLSLVNLAYVLRKNQGQERAAAVVARLFRECGVLSLSDMNVYNALRSACPDFEDAMQISCADLGDCDCIITNNTRHFRGFAPMPVFTPEEFLGE